MQPDKIVVVNMGDPLFTGRKRQQKLYRHHTGYPGGLKTFSFKEVMMKNPDRVLHEAIMGMLPKHHVDKRKELIEKNVVTFMGNWHDYDFLPQFTDPVPEDLNEFIALHKDDSVLKYFDTRDGKIPEEFKDFEVDLDPEIGYTPGVMKK
mmetsp:Transcript_1539/g.2714  ORF Transcript_1539/g.2714 Transcript_1539/m.2714 type:complete len:149 (+) Transcript_1539:660-1106(+)